MVASQLDAMRSSLLLVLAGSVLALVALWRVRQASYRASFALLCWIGVIGLGMQPETWLERSLLPANPPNEQHGAVVAEMQR